MSVSIDRSNYYITLITRAVNTLIMCVLCVPAHGSILQIYVVGFPMYLQYLWYSTSLREVLCSSRVPSTYQVEPPPPSYPLLASREYRRKERRQATYPSKNIMKPSLNKIHPPPTLSFSFFRKNIEC
jgi:hypothetical protein